MATIHDLIRPIQRRFRARRMAEFARVFSVDAETRILDVGGTPFNWELIDVRPRVTLVNLDPKPTFAVPENMRYVPGDACRLPFADGAFDIVYSNSVIEHLGTWEHQQMMAAEIRRVGRSYYVQTPSRSFPIEPHLVGLNMHALPPALHRSLIPVLTLHGWWHRPSLRVRNEFLSRIRLLSGSDVANLFPDATLLRERFAGLTKSFVAFRASRS